ncbi:hypothetical protein ACFQ8T_04355 [Isoptericola sp. NPDC056618]|uniref:hypothetical protein n=1 Tax=Isoptericola sp. NPDC056618 TaxID=3345878 RepID=UPI0036B6E906
MPAPDYDRPVTSADDAAEHLRALVHATRWFDDPGDTYWVTADVLVIARRLQSVLVNVASAHMHHRELARTDDGNQFEGRNHAYDAAMTLRKASLLLERAEGLIDEAQSHSGRIAWRGAEPDGVEREPRGPRARVVDMRGKRARRQQPGRTL